MFRGSLSFGLDSGHFAPNFRGYVTSIESGSFVATHSTALMRKK